jgi:hypothetical protein
MNTFIITEILLHCHSFFFKYYFCFFFEHIFSPTWFIGKCLQWAVSLSLFPLCAPRWSGKLLHYYGTWMTYRYNFWLWKLVIIYFLNLCVRNSNNDNHFVSLQTVDLTPGGCPNKMLKFCTLLKTFFSPLGSFQCDVHCVTSDPIERIFNIQKCTHWTWLSILYVLCSAVFLHPATPVAFIAVCCSGNFFLNWISIQILKKEKRIRPCPI